MNKRLEVVGLRSSVVSCIAQTLGISELDGERIFEVLQSEHYPFSGNQLIAYGMGMGNEGLLVANGLYYLSIKMTTLSILVLLLDIAITKGAASAAVQFAGGDLRGITKLNRGKGEPCIVKEGLLAGAQGIDSDILADHKGMCINHDLPCGFRKGESCTCSQNDILDALKHLEECHVFYLTTEGKYRLNF